MQPATFRFPNELGGLKVREHIRDERAAGDGLRDREKDAPALYEGVSPVFEHARTDRYKLAEPLVTLEELLQGDGAA